MQATVNAFSIILQTFEGSLGMKDWLDYQLTDFILFSVQTWERVLEQHNHALWPLQGILVAGLLILMWKLYRRPGSTLWHQVSLVVLAGLWTFVGWSFLLGRYAAINPAATWGGYGFILEAALLLGLGGSKLKLSTPLKKGKLVLFGGFLTLWQGLFQPLFNLIQGTSVWRLEIFGIMPDPTALVTIGLILMRTNRQNRNAAIVLLLIPVLWCLFSGLTLLGLGISGAWILLAIPIMVAMGVAMFTRPEVNQA